MAASNPGFSDYQKFTPPTYEEPPRSRGCFFYGCIIASILALLLLIAVGVVLFLFYQWAGRMVEEYTATAPRELPKVEMPAEQLKTLKERVEAFRAAVKEGKPTEPLVLNSDEINALIDEEQKLKGKVYVSIDQEKLKGQVSIPLDDFPSFGLTRGRFLNGEAEFKVSLEDGVLIVTLDSIEVNGKSLPPEFMTQMRSQNLAKDAYKDAKTAQEIRNLQSIEIRDGKVTIRARDRTKAPESGEKESTRVETRDGKVIIHPPQEKSAPKAEASPAETKAPGEAPEPIVTPPPPPSALDKAPSR